MANLLYPGSGGPSSLFAPRPTSTSFGSVPSYRDRMDQLFGRTRDKASKLSSATRSGAAKLGLVGSADSVGGVVSSGAPLVLAGAAAGAIDASALGRQFDTFVHGTMKASTAMLAVGLAARMFGLDRRFPRLRRYMNHFFSAKIGIIGYGVGERVMRSDLAKKVGIGDVEGEGVEGAEVEGTATVA